MKCARVWLSISLLLVVAGYSAAQAPASKAEAKGSDLLSGQPLSEDPKDDELRKLLKARYNEALAEVDVASKLFQAAQGSYDSVAGARQRLLRAGLELCDQPADKVALLTQHVERAVAAEKVAQAAQEAGRGSAAAVHRARYQRLDAEIQLLRAKREADKAKGK